MSFPKSSNAPPSIGEEEDQDIRSGTTSKQANVTADEAAELAIGSIDQTFTIDSDNSPYPEVRCNVPNTDDYELPVNTFRMWFLGVTFTMVRNPERFHSWSKLTLFSQLGAGINQFFSMRYPSVTITSLVAQLLSFPMGCILANALPVKTFRIFGRWNFELNPDHRFNVKEHVVITIMSNLSFGASWVSHESPTLTTRD